MFCFRAFIETHSCHFLSNSRKLSEAILQNEMPKNDPHPKHWSWEKASITDRGWEGNEKSRCFIVTTGKWTPTSQVPRSILGTLFFSTGWGEIQVHDVECRKFDKMDRKVSWMFPKMLSAWEWDEWLRTWREGV